MPRKFNHPVWLTGTEEQQKAEAERQALALAIHSRAKMTEAERLVGRGKLLEETARGNNAKDQLADALAMQGRFKEAAETHTDKHRRKYFREIVKALEMSDDAKCNCKDEKAKFGKDEIALTPRFERDRIFSPIHNEVVSLVECSKCGHKNARPLRSRLLKAKQAAPGLNDVQVLR